MEQMLPKMLAQMPELPAVLGAPGDDAPEEEEAGE